MNLWQRLLLKLGIASTKLVSADNELFAEQAADNKATLLAWQRHVVSDLLRLANSHDPILGEQFRIEWRDWLQRTS